MNENIAISAIIVVGILAFMGLAVTAGNYSTYKIAEMVKAGANPIDARCAINSYNDPVCLMRTLGAKQ